MTTIPDTPFGARVRERLRDEQFAWLTMVGADGTPEPNPVWFLWDGGDEILVYNDNQARRLDRIGDGVRASLNLQANAEGDDVVVLTGTLEPARDAPNPAENQAFLAKYAAAIETIGYTAEQFGGRYDVATRLRVDRVRGW